MVEALRQRPRLGKLAPATMLRHFGPNDFRARIEKTPARPRAKTMPAANLRGEAIVTDFGVNGTAQAGRGMTRHAW